MIAIGFDPGTARLGYGVIESEPDPQADRSQQPHATEAKDNASRTRDFSSSRRPGAAKPRPSGEKRFSAKKRSFRGCGNTPRAA